MSDTSQSVQHRCPRMDEHMRSKDRACACHPYLPIPCGECYSLIVTAERIAYRPNVHWHDVTGESA